MRILVLDPSFREFGWATINVKNGKETVTDFGIIKSIKDNTVSKSQDFIARTDFLAEELFKVVDTFKPTVVKAEVPYGFQNANACATLSTIRGLIVGMCKIKKIKYIPLLPHEVRKITLNKAFSSKDDVATFVFSKYPELKSELYKSIKSKSERLAITDAICVHLADKMRT